MKHHASSMSYSSDAAKSMTLHALVMVVVCVKKCILVFNIPMGRLMAEVVHEAVMAKLLSDHLMSDPLLELTQPWTR